ncbi:MAG: folylpolyglutamate synthase/dihydrofolate synthase family protein [Bacillota bacterium]|nr:folylpolyglutamate synthase/dihydrofolate synthase family protein [Bacillota bacterium]
MTTAVDKFHEFDRFGSVLGLERVNELLRRLGNPHEGMRYIHVAGTNGKGSVSKFIESGLAGCGYKVGLYTSPYIEKFNERIQFDGQMITDEELELYGDQALAKAAEMTAEGLTSPTEFEVVMATAFLYFKAKAPDIVVLEAGMGGIGDATNVISSPLASVFTSVSFDHMHILGNTLEEIAADKAGIIKRGCPVVSNVSQHGPAAVIAKKAYEMNSRLYDVSKIKFSIDWESPVSQQVSMELWQTDYSEVIISMVGRHQAENLKTALATIEILRKAGELNIERSKLYAGLQKAIQPGRFEVILGRELAANGERLTLLGEDSPYAAADGTPVVVIDGAHNDAGAKAIADTMLENFPDWKTLIVFGMVEKKETEKVIGHFLEVTRDFIVTQPSYEGRAMSAQTLAEIVRAVAADKGVEVNIIDCLDKASDSIDKAASIWRDYDVVLFAGSLYLIGEVRSILKNNSYDPNRTLKYGNQ